MAIHKVEVLRDDMDGSLLAESHVLTLDGETWTLDLSPQNYGALCEALRPFLSKATKGRRRRKAASPATKSDQGAIRAWARANGYEVSARGSVSSELRAAYMEAMFGESGDE